MNDSRLNDLFTEFRKKYPKMDYFTQEEIFQFGRMCFHLGYDSNNRKTSNTPVIRSDGKQYESISSASKANKISQPAISGSIKEGWKAAGYHWKYADKYHIISK